LYTIYQAICSILTLKILYLGSRLTVAAIRITIKAGNAAYSIVINIDCLTSIAKMIKLKLGKASQKVCSLAQSLKKRPIIKIIPPVVKKAVKKVTVPA